jgi:hypothetical protein
MVEYDQDLAGAEPITFPIGGFSKFSESPKGNKLTVFVDVPSILPSEPFSVIVHGSTGKPPLAKKATLKADGLMLDFNILRISN